MYRPLMNRGSVTFMSSLRSFVLASFFLALLSFAGDSSPQTYFRKAAEKKVLYQNCLLASHAKLQTAASTSIFYKACLETSHKGLYELMKFERKILPSRMIAAHVTPELSPGMFKDTSLFASSWLPRYLIKTYNLEDDCELWYHCTRGNMEALKHIKRCKDPSYESLMIAEHLSKAGLNDSPVTQFIDKWRRTMFTKMENLNCPVTMSVRLTCMFPYINSRKFEETIKELVHSGADQNEGCQSAEQTPLWMVLGEVGLARNLGVLLASSNSSTNFEPYPTLVLKALHAHSAHKKGLDVAEVLLKNGLVPVLDHNTMFYWANAFTVEGIQLLKKYNIYPVEKAERILEMIESKLRAAGSITDVQTQIAAKCLLTYVHFGLIEINTAAGWLLKTMMSTTISGGHVIVNTFFERTGQTAKLPMSYWLEHFGNFENDIKKTEIDYFRTASLLGFDAFESYVNAVGIAEFPILKAAMKGHTQFFYNTKQWRVLDSTKNALFAALDHSLIGLLFRIDFAPESYDQVRKLVFLRNALWPKKLDSDFFKTYRFGGTITPDQAKAEVDHFLQSGTMDTDAVLMQMYKLFSEISLLRKDFKMVVRYIQTLQVYRTVQCGQAGAGSIFQELLPEVVDLIKSRIAELP